jgi:hypothetical protein
MAESPCLAIPASQTASAARSLIFMVADQQQWRTTSEDLKNFPAKPIHYINKHTPSGLLQILAGGAFQAEVDPEPRWGKE